ncbi:hypothetical protein SPBR_09161 [Sporothrix brasiliensis 5110]|uniref:Zn(2)-C6 fungal-type domain-containing protein n=1 Tax=Sporothrix brasiliensis 5110 TaxID=1398154 RepID=A0A0C2J8V0_9PEZI|nr:uncharacterized protein SPBR_09161 [Sporothrix brasiliensis 5110]KIH93402.1 hypothetical protein SPBR_09161 [Sporothrix brasiliensis 5110]
MPAVRSRLGCDECRRRRRKCDEAKPACGPCTGARRSCRYTLKIVRGASTFAARRPSAPRGWTRHDRNDRSDSHDSHDRLDRHDTDTVPPPVGPLVLVRLPNGVPLAPPYQRLLDYFARDVLASLSVHPAIHRDLAQGLVPAMLRAPHLLSAGLALAATGLASRGRADVGGVGLPRVMQHLQTAGLALLRQALERNAGGRGDRATDGDGDGGRGDGGLDLVATCLLWCLADVFAADVSLPSSSSSSSSWRIHLHGIEALLGGARALDAFVTRGQRGADDTSAPSSSSRSAMGHLHQLYRSLQTLPHITRRQGGGGTAEMSKPGVGASIVVELDTALPKAPGWPRIDGFLGYSEELLDILQQLEGIASTLPAMDDWDDNTDGYTNDYATDDLLAAPHLTDATRAAAADLLARAHAQALVLDDGTRSTEPEGPPCTAPPDEVPPAPPRVAHIPAPALTAAAARELALCHGCFQQATLIHIYRRLFRLPSRAPRIQQAAAQIRRMAGQMRQGAPCSAWVAMALPLFTAGCEAYTPAAQAWAHAALAAFAASIGSRHVQLLRRALEDLGRLRARRGDTDGRLCAGPLLEELNYNIILF